MLESQNLGQHTWGPISPGPPGDPSTPLLPVNPGLPGCPCGPLLPFSPTTKKEHYRITSILFSTKVVSCHRDVPTDVVF